MYLNPARLWRYNQMRRQYLGKKGRLLNWTTVRVGPEGLERRTPYVVGLVQVGKEKVMTQIAEIKTQDLHKGIWLVGRLRRLFDVPDEQLVVYGVKFTPEREND